MILNPPVGASSAHALDFLLVSEAPAPRLDAMAPAGASAGHAAKTGKSGAKRRGHAA